MTGDSVRYRDLRHWKYQVMNDVRFETPLTGYEHDARYFTVTEDGVLEIREGYCWDGPSGPVWHTPSALRPSLVHDVFYQLIRMGIMSRRHRKRVDDLFHAQLLEDGMGRFRAWYFWKAVRLFGWRAASKDEPYPAVRTAP